MVNYNVDIHLGERNLKQRFAEIGEAAALVQAAFKDEALRWKDPTEASAKGGVLTIKCKQLEELIETTPSELRPEIAKKLGIFMNGKWQNEVKKTTKKVVSTSPIGLVSLLEICVRNKWTPRKVRVKLRGAKIKKPSDLWAWTPNEAKKIEVKLKELMLT